MVLTHCSQCLHIWSHSTCKLWFFKLFVAVVLLQPNYDCPADCGMQRLSPAQLSHIVLGKTLLWSTTAALPLLPSEKRNQREWVQWILVSSWPGSINPNSLIVVVIKIAFPFLGKSQCTSSFYCSLLSLCLTSDSLNLSPPLFCTHLPSLLLPSLSFPSSKNTFINICHCLSNFVFKFCIFYQKHSLE